MNTIQRLGELSLFSNKLLSQQCRDYSSNSLCVVINYGFITSLMDFKFTGIYEFVFYFSITRLSSSLYFTLVFTTLILLLREHNNVNSIYLRSLSFRKTQSKIFPFVLPLALPTKMLFV